MRYVSLLLALLIVIGCSTAGTTRPADMPRPEVEIRQTGSLFFGSGSTAPAFLELGITNSGSQPLIVRRIRIESPGMAQYGLAPMERTYRETIAPGETRSLSITPTAVTSTSRPTEPLTLRATVYFETNGSQFREIYTAQASSGPY